MQIVTSKGKIVEKTLRDKGGRLVHAKFYVYENAGVIKARLLDFVYVSEEVIKSEVFFLTGFSKSYTQGNPVYNLKSFASPFVTKGILYFSGSKPRAPTI